MNRLAEDPCLTGVRPTLPPQPISTDVLREKYLKDGETTIEQLYDRVARALASVEKPELRAQYEAQFRRNLDAGAIGAGRIMSAAGTGIQATLINCFVQPVGDCIQGTDDDGYPGIYEALREAAETMRRGGGVGYDFSRIRPKGACVKGTASTASGPCSYINVFHHRQAHAGPPEPLPRLGGRARCFHHRCAARHRLGTGAPGRTRC